jgi:large subunit ribosomal protein L4
MEVPVYNMSGDQVGNMPIDEASLGGVINPALIKQAYVRYHSNLRQGSARSKNRGEVSGSKKKISKQKGTGRARHGSKRPPQFRGGGHWKSTRRTREDFRLDMPKKMRRQANRNALLAKLLDSEVRVIDTIRVDAPKTKIIKDMLSALKIDGTALMALSANGEASSKARLSARNVESLTLCRADQLTCFEMLNHRFLVIEKGELESWLTGPSSQVSKDAKIEPKGAGNGAKEARKPRPKRGPVVKQAARAAKKAGATGGEG